MTLCIATLANDRSENKLVLCSDQLLGDDLHSTETEYKTDIGFSESLASLYCGTWSDAEDLKRILKKHANLEPLTLSNYKRLLTDGLNEFAGLLKGIGKEESDAGCVIAGFVEGVPRIVRVDLEGVEVLPYFSAIGIGSYHANTILCWRKITQFTSLEWALYYVYEAKKFGELCKDVGKQTLIEVLSLDAEGVFHVDLVKQAGFEILEKWFERFRPQRMTHLDRFPATAFDRVREWSG
jgi:20S proteasome alpha/beta subunit